ncbi:hypothetical protein V2J09_016317 [Rumex salicifolius]
MNYAEVGDEEKTTLLLTYKGKNQDVQTIWYLDIGPSNHMCGRRNIFVSLAVIIFVEGKGDIIFRAKDGSHQIISDVYYVPKMTSNIPSLG